MQYIVVLWVCLSVLLSACGGGGSGAGQPVTSATPLSSAPSSASSANSLASLASSSSSLSSSSSSSSSVSSAAASAIASTFGLSSDANFYTVDTGAGLVFNIRRVDNGVSTQSAGDISSLMFNGVQFQDTARGSQLNSGFDYMYTGVSAVEVSALQVDAEHIKITVVAGNTTHYYLVKKGLPHIYMGTYFTTEPDTLGLVRYILRMQRAALPNGPVPSDISQTVSTIEASDIFALANGETRSKHYSNMRLKDWQYIGATGTNVGLWMVRDNHEGGSGGPFYRSLLNQGTTTSQEITYIVNYGEAQTEEFRTSILNSYTLVFTDGSTPKALNTDWFANMNLLGYVPASARGKVAGTSMTGRDVAFDYTVGFANSRAQYWAAVAPLTGAFETEAMIPGSYTMSVYKNELVVDTRTVVVEAGKVTSAAAIAINGDPSSTAARWRIGAWDGSPAEFINGDKLTIMHPSDIRLASWVPTTYVVGASTPATGFPAYQWKDVNGTLTLKFTLNADQIMAYTLRAGITVAFSGARPKVGVNSWVSANPSPSTQPKTRTLTVGTYRGNNTTYSFSIPASAFVVGENTLTLTAISGTSGTGYLSPGYAYDAVDLIPAL